ncbi:hypothetical protein ACFV1T_18235, partial [Streptomyces vinaceus]
GGAGAGGGGGGRAGAPPRPRAAAAAADQGLPEPYRLDSRPLTALAREFRTSPIVAALRR